MITDRKIKRLRDIGAQVPFSEYYPHTHCDCWKILNPHTEYCEDKLVLCTEKEGFTKAVNLALRELTQRKKAMEEQTLRKKVK